jgi:ssDNA-binding Zn-finger/Zn-ribbon topoisomerase 1
MLFLFALCRGGYDPTGYDIWENYEEEDEEESEEDVSQILCPLCGQEMVKKDGKNGLFWGCTKFPLCRGSRDAKHLSPSCEYPDVIDVLNTQPKASSKPQTKEVPMAEKTPTTAVAAIAETGFKAAFRKMKVTAIDGAKTAAAAEAAHRIRVILMRRLKGTPVEPFIDFLPDEVLDYVLSAVVAVAADNLEMIPGRVQVSAVATKAMEGSAHNAFTVILKHIMPLIDDLRQVARDYVQGDDSSVIDVPVVDVAEEAPKKRK